MRNRPEVLKELAEDVPAALLFDHVGTQKLTAGGLNGLLQEHLLTLKFDVAQTFVRESQRTIGCLGSRREPTFVDPAAVSAEGIEVAGIEFEPPARHQERAWDPAWREAHNTLALRQCLEYQVLV